LPKQKSRKDRKLDQAIVDEAVKPVINPTANNQHKGKAIVAVQ
jgi:hypothetical protein